jgi:hypothetical protein
MVVASNRKAMFMKKLIGVLLGTALGLPLIGCPEHTRIYVGTYGPAETPYYTQWERERHYQHMEYERRKRAEQRAYWEWRKHHHDRD